MSIFALLTRKAFFNKTTKTYNLLKMKKTALIFCFCLLTFYGFAQQKVEKIDQILAYPHTQYEVNEGLRLVNVISKDKNAQILQIVDKKGNVLEETIALQRKYVGKAKDIYTYTFAQLASQQNKIQMTLIEGQKGFSQGIDEGTKTTFLLTPQGTWQKIQESRFREKIIEN